MKKKKAAAVILSAAAILGAFTACGEEDTYSDSVVIDMNDEEFSEIIKGSGSMTEKSVSVPDGIYSFSTGTISNSNSNIKVIIDPSASESKIEADDNVCDDLTLSVDEAGQKIILSGRSGVMYENMNYTLTIGAKVSSVNVSGSVQTDYTIPEEVTEINVSAEGASVVSVKGSCDLASYDISGVSKLNAADAEAGNVKVSVSGTSSAEVYAKNELDAEASGMSTINYSGNPSSVKEDASGQSSINKK